MIKIRVKLTIVFCIRLLEASAYGAYRDPIAKTNINPKTDLFEKEIEDYGTFRDHMGSLKEQAVNGITSSGNLELISDKTGDEIKAAASDLNVIKASDLQVKGQEEVLRTGMTELHVDYTDPLIAGHKKDASRIAEASGVLLGKLTDLFKEFGIDCRTVKGNKVTQPEYYIDVKKEQVKDTVYTKAMCEELRNRYSCHDILTVRCNKRRINWGTWQNRIIEFEGSDVFYNHRGWTKSEYYRRVHESSRGWISMTRIDFNFESSAVLISIGDEIARRLGVLREQITDVEVPVVYNPVFGRNWQMPYHGAWFFIEGNTEVFKIIRLHYKFRTREEICGEWVDEWDEVCGLES